MAADTSVVKPVEAPPLTALSIKSKLAATPKSAPKYSVSVQNTAGQSVTLADPRATRALVALMNVHAVNGGAACHWGGPAAFAEMMAAIAEIEDIRPAHVRGNVPGGPAAAKRALELLATLRAKAHKLSV